MLYHIHTVTTHVIKHMLRYVLYNMLYTTLLPDFQNFIERAYSVT